MKIIRPSAETRLPRWLIIATIGFTLLILAMAVAETNLWMHFLVDRGEYVSIAGVAFITVVGFYLYKRNSLRTSLPLFIPWLLYPILTQGDQLIDNLSINQMRVVCHIILAIIFAAPIVVAIRAIPSSVSPRTVTWLTLTLGLIEVWIAYQFLGVFMIFTLGFMGMVFVFYRVGLKRPGFAQEFSEQAARRIMIAAVVFSLGMFFGFKNRPGAYQGSPAAFMDPSQSGAVYDLTRIAVVANSDTPLSRDDAAEVRSVFVGYGEVLKGLVHAYWVLDRNYNYAFHNELFWRATPIVEDFRGKALSEIRTMRDLAMETDDRSEQLASQLPAGSSAAVLIREVREFVAYSLQRAAKLEQMSATFEQTKAGLQHATHLYEGEGKMVDVVLTAIVEKHRTTLDAPTLVAAADPFVESTRQVHRTYGNRIIGF